MCDSEKLGLRSLKNSFNCLICTVTPAESECSLLTFDNRNHNWHLYNMLAETASGCFTFNIKAEQNKCNYCTVMKFVSVLNVLIYVAESMVIKELKMAPKWIVKESCNFFLIYGQSKSRQNKTLRVFIFYLTWKRNNFLSIVECIYKMRPTSKLLG